MIPFSAFPQDSVDPKLKAEKKWLLEYCRAVIYAYGNLPIDAIGVRSRAIYEKNKKYALGRQPVDKYKRIFNNGEDGQNRLLVTDWSIRAEITKLRRIIVSLVEKLPFKVQINPVDDLAKTEMEDELLMAEAKILARQALQQHGATDLLQMPNMQLAPNEPENLDELGIKELGMRHRTAMELEMVAQLVFNANNFDDLVGELTQDLIDCGVMCVKDDTVNDSTVSLRRIDPRDLIINYCRKPDFSDWKHIGELNRIQACQLIAISDGQISEDDIKQIYELGHANIQQWCMGLNMGSWANYNDFYQQGVVYVLDVEIRSTDKVILESRELKSGNILYAKTNPDKKKSPKNEYKEKNVENIYVAKWVVGTEIMFDYGKKKNTKRDRFNTANVKSSFHIGACDFYDMRTTSRVEELIPYADAIQLATYRLQHALNTVVPKGYLINFDALESVDLGAGGQSMTPKDILDLFFDRGILLARNADVAGKPIGRAIETLEGGVGSEIQEFWTLITQNKQMMRECLGLNELTDASTPNARILTEIAKAATAGTNNALSDLFKAQRKIVKSLTESIVLRVQDIVHYGNDSYLISSLGVGSIKVLKNIGDIDKYLYSVEIEDNPSQDELLSLQEQIKIAQQQGTLDISDIMMLDNISNVKQRQEFLVYKVKKNKEQRQKEAMQMQQQNGQVQMQSAQAAEQARQQTLQLEFELKMKYEQMVKDLELRNSQAIKQFDLERERIAASGRVEASVVQAEGRDKANMRDNTTKLIADNKEDKKDIIQIPVDLNSNVTPQTAGGKALELKPFSFLPDENEEEGNEQMPQTMQQEASENPQMEQQEPMQQQQMEQQQGMEAPMQGEEQGEEMPQEPMQEGMPMMPQ
jgi:hypothetical protein